MIEFVVDVWESLRESAKFTASLGFQLGLELLENVARNSTMRATMRCASSSTGPKRSNGVRPRTHGAPLGVHSTAVGNPGEGRYLRRCGFL
jgi:hypothetical protein